MARGKLFYVSLDTEYSKGDLSLSFPNNHSFFLEKDSVDFYIFYPNVEQNNIIVKFPEEDLTI